MSKRRWWEQDERFKKVARNLRKNYDDAVAKIESEHAKKVKTEVERVRAHYEKLNEERDAKLAKLAGEVARMTLEFGPSKFGTHFRLYVQMDERFILRVPGRRSEMKRRTCCYVGTHLLAAPLRPRPSACTGRRARCLMDIGIVMVLLDLLWWIRR